MSANADPAPTEVKEDLGRCFFGPVDLAYGTSSRVLPHTSPPGPPYERMRGRARGGAQVSPDPGQDSTPKSSPNLWSSIAESIIERNDNFPYKTTDWVAHQGCIQQFYQLYVKGFDFPRWSTSLGPVKKSFVDHIKWPQEISLEPSNARMVLEGDSVRERSERFRKGLAGLKCRTTHNPVNLPLRETLVPIFSRQGRHVMDVNHTVVPILGIPTYNVYLIAWTSISGTPHWWMSRRATSAFPDKLDTTGCAILHYKTNPYDMARNMAKSLTSLPDETIRDLLQSDGTVSYHHLLDDCWGKTSHPRVHYLYSIQLDLDLQLSGPFNDQTFEKYSFEQPWESVQKGEVRGDVEMTMLAHFIKLGYVNPSNEPNLHKVEPELHRSIGLPASSNVERPKYWME